MEASLAVDPLDKGGAFVVAADVLVTLVDVAEVLPVVWCPVLPVVDVVF